MSSIPRPLRLLPLAFCLLGACATDSDQRLHAAHAPRVEDAHVQYLEIVTPEVEATCASLTDVHGLSFGDPRPELGQARTALRPDGTMIGVRAPMHEMEEPVVRPYVLVDDLQSAVDAVEAAGAQLAMPPTPIPGGGSFAIYFQGGVQYGLWQL